MTKAAEVEVQITPDDKGGIKQAVAGGVLVAPGEVVPFEDWNGGTDLWLKVKGFYDSPAYGPSVEGDRYTSKAAAPRQFAGKAVIPLALIARGAAGLVARSPRSSKERAKCMADGCGSAYAGVVGHDDVVRAGVKAEAREDGMTRLCRRHREEVLDG